MLTLQHEYKNEMTSKEEEKPAIWVKEAADPEGARRKWARAGREAGMGPRLQGS